MSKSNVTLINILKICTTYFLISIVFLFSSNSYSFYENTTTTPPSYEYVELEEKNGACKDLTLSSTCSKNIAETEEVVEVVREDTSAITSKIFNYGSCENANSCSKDTNGHGPCDCVKKSILNRDGEYSSIPSKNITSHPSCKIAVEYSWKKNIDDLFKSYGRNLAAFKILTNSPAGKKWLKMNKSRVSLSCDDKNIGKMIRGLTQKDEKGNFSCDQETLGQIINVTKSYMKKCDGGNEDPMCSEKNHLTLDGGNTSISSLSHLVSEGFKDLDKAEKEGTNVIKGLMNQYLNSTNRLYSSQYGAVGSKSEIILSYYNNADDEKFLEFFEEVFKNEIKGYREQAGVKSLDPSYKVSAKVANKDFSLALESEGVSAEEKVHILLNNLALEDGACNELEDKLHNFCYGVTKEKTQNLHKSMEAGGSYSQFNPDMWFEAGLDGKSAMVMSCYYSGGFGYGKGALKIAFGKNTKVEDLECDTKIEKIGKSKGVRKGSSTLSMVGGDKISKAEQAKHVIRSLGREISETEFSTSVETSTSTSVATKAQSLPQDPGLKTSSNSSNTEEKYNGSSFASSYISEEDKKIDQSFAQGVAQAATPIPMASNNNTESKDDEESSDFKESSENLSHSDNASLNSKSDEDQKISALEKQLENLKKQLESVKKDSADKDKEAKIAALKGQIDKLNNDLSDKKNSVAVSGDSSRSGTVKSARPEASKPKSSSSQPSRVPASISTGGVSSVVTSGEAGRLGPKVNENSNIGAGVVGQIKIPKNGAISLTKNAINYEFTNTEKFKSFKGTNEFNKFLSELAPKDLVDGQTYIVQLEQSDTFFKVVQRDGKVVIDEIRGAYMVSNKGTPKERRNPVRLNDFTMGQDAAKDKREREEAYKYSVYELERALDKGAEASKASENQ